MQNIDEVISDIFGFNASESDFGKDGAVVGNGQQMITALGDVAQKVFRVLLISTTIVGNQNFASRFQPFLKMKVQNSKSGRNELQEILFSYEKVGKKRFFVANVQQSVSAVDDVKRLVREDGFRDIRDFETDLKI